MIMAVKEAVKSWEEWKEEAREVIPLMLLAAKAELRAAVFLALEEQEKVENKAPLVNESLKKFLNTKDGRLVCGLVTEFLQFFNLDFTLAVFQPETSTLNVTQNRQNLARDLGIVEVEGARGSPLLMEVLKLCRQKDKGSSIESDSPASIYKDLSSKQISEAKKKLEFYDKVVQDIPDIAPAPLMFTDAKTSNTQSKIPRYKGLHKHAWSSEKAGEQMLQQILVKGSQIPAVSFQRMLGLMDSSTCLVPHVQLRIRPLQ